MQKNDTIGYFILKVTMDKTIIQANYSEITQNWHLGTLDSKIYFLYKNRKTN